MIRSIILIFSAIMIGIGCQSTDSSEKSSEYLATLMTLDPGHFHSALVQKNMYPEVNPTAWVYAPEGDEVREHLAKIEQYNSDPNQPTHWTEEVYTGDDFAEKMFEEKPGNVMVVAGNNRLKTDYILRAVREGIHVFADKPMAINGDNYEKLKEAFQIAEENDVLLYDIMTERFEITTILQRAFSQIPDVFGSVAESSAEDPAITKESVHHFSKIVSGNPLIRPAWFFDVEQQGSGIVDVSTHLIDLIMWSLFPEENLKPSDTNIEKAKQWATEITPAQFKQVTGMDRYPDYLRKDIVQDSVLEVFSNGEIDFQLRGIYGKASVIWNFEAPAGGGDTHFSVFRGTTANLVIRQDQSTGFEPILFVEPVSEYDPSDWEKIMADAIEIIQKDHPDISFKPSENGFEIVIPDQYKVGHEAHFGQVTEQYLRYLKQGSIPQWEKDFMLTKYYLTTKAYEESKVE